MNPAEIEAHKKAWRKKTRREARLFAHVVSAFGGAAVDDLVPPESEAEPEA